MCILHACLAAVADAQPKHANKPNERTEKNARLVIIIIRPVQWRRVHHGVQSPRPPYAALTSCAAAPRLAPLATAAGPAVAPATAAAAAAATSRDHAFSPNTMPSTRAAASSANRRADATGPTYISTLPCGAGVADQAVRPCPALPASCASGLPGAAAGPPSSCCSCRAWSHMGALYNQRPQLHPHHDPGWYEVQGRLRCRLDVL